MADIQDFPIMWEDFVKTYEFDDSCEVYTNRAMLIPSFRVEQMVKHYFAEPMSRPMVTRCKDCENLTKDPDGDEWCGYLKRHVDPSDFCSWGWKDDFVACKCGEDIERHDRIQVCPSCGRKVMA